jgi:hypothetical protein
MSFFEWIREGVRQAVMLGLADAVEEVGTRVREEDLGPALAQTLRERAGPRATATTVTPALPTGRRRLGRSISTLATVTGEPSEPVVKRAA